MEFCMENIGPELATGYLEKNFGNRDRNTGKIRAISREISEGRFQTSHQAIAFDQNGNLLDGQHRLYAIIHSGCHVNIMVARGVPSCAKSGIDCGTPRQTADLLKWENPNISSPRPRASIALSIFTGMSWGHKTLMNSEKVAFVHNYKDALDFILVNCSKPCRNPLKPSVLGAVGRAYLQPNCDKVRLAEFLKVMETGMIQHQYDQPAILLRNWLLQTVHLTKEVFPKASSALQAFLKKEIKTRLYATTTNFFPLPTDKNDEADF